MKIFRRAAILFAFLTAGCASRTEIPAVEDFDLRRYLGTWYEIARTPNRFQKGMIGVTAVYSLLPDGSVKVVNSGVKAGEKREITGFARMRSAPDKGELEVSFFRPFYSDYRIIYLDPEYRFAIVSGSGAEYLWILSRTPELPPGTMEKLLGFLRQHGLPVGELIYSR